LDASEIWDRWCAARVARPSITAEEFAALFGPRSSEVHALVATLRQLGEQRELPPLVDVLPRLDGAPGRPFAGFELEHGLGAGSTGIVFAARDRRAGAGGERIALKILNPVLATSPARRDAVLREAEVAGRMEHPGIARTLASGVERGYAWIASEWVEGDTLQALLEMEEEELAASVDALRDARARLRPELALDPHPSVRAWPLAAQAALEVGLQLVPAIAHAHERGIVHRDLKPANALLAQDGRVKVIDFGLALVEGTRLAVSSAGEWGGTPLYMAPEQMRGASAIGPAADVHALGLILADVATGSISSPERLAAGSLVALARSAADALREASRALPPGLRRVVTRCTEPDPRHRYASCIELFEDLECLHRGAPLRHGPASAVVRFARAVRREKPRALAIAGAAVVAAGAFAWAWRLATTGMVRIATGRQGEQVWIDGRACGLAPVEVRLDGGEHEVRFRWDEGQPFCAPIALVVEPREHAAHTYVLEPTLGVETQPVAPGLAHETSAWLQVATPSPRIRLRVDDVDHGELPGIVALRLPLGENRVRIEAPGKRAVERVASMRDGRLCFVTAELDDADSPWTTIVLYCPFDALVVGGLRSADGVRAYCETLPKTWLDLSTVNKSYWGPSEEGADGECTVALDLPFVLGALEVEVGDPDIPVSASAAGAWHALDLGAEGREWLPLYEVRRGFAPPGDIALNRATLTRIPAVLGDRRELRLRFRLGGASIGDANARACALRTNALPQRTRAGELLWQPALRLRIRPRT
jgi:hypothetical protein